MEGQAGVVQPLESDGKADASLPSWPLDETAILQHAPDANDNAGDTTHTSRLAAFKTWPELNLDSGISVMNLQWALPDTTELHRSTTQPSGPSGGVQKKVAGKRRGKTFTGCWTCRSRHVKCDEGRPSCRRCVAGGFECQGYERRLTWLSNAGDTPSSSHREALVGTLAGKAKEFVIVTDRSARNGSENRASLSSESSSTPPPKRSRTVARNRQPRSAAQATSRKAARKLPVSPNFEWIADGETVAAEPGQPFAAPTLVSNVLAVGWTPPSTATGTLWPLVQDYQHVHDSSASPPDGSMGWPGYIGDPATPLDAFSGPSHQRALINHWVTDLAHKLIPIRSVVNPLLTVASPMALQGSRLRPGQTSSSAAVFHAICALSATHQENLRGGSGGETALARYHHRLSFQHLMSNIGSTDIDERMASLATLCIWLLSHFVSGTTGAWRELVRVTRNLLEETSMATWSSSVTASLTYQSFASSFTLIQSQYMGRAEFPRPMKTDLAGSNVTNNLAMPDNSLQLISSFNTKLLDGSIMRQDEVDQLELEFALTTPPPSTDLESDKSDSAMAHHHRLLFYYASLLYFRCNSGRRGAEEEVQSLVARCLSHMEHLDSMQLNVSPRAWVFAAVAFEAGTPELRDRVRRSFSKRKELGISSWDTLRLAAEEVWRLRDNALPGDVPEPWTHMLPRMPEYDVLLY